MASTSGWIQKLFRWVLNGARDAQLTPPSPSANSNERAPSHTLFESRDVIITDGHFNQTHGHHIVINVNQGSLLATDSRSGSPPSNETRHPNVNPAQFSGQSTRVDERNQVSSQAQEIPFQKSNDIYERHLTPKGRGFPLWIPNPDQDLPSDYRRTGVRIGDVGIITDSGEFSFLFNICLPRNNPVNPTVLPEHFTPISPPIEAIDIGKVVVFRGGDDITSASVKRLRTGTAISDIVFESSASEGAILTMPRGARTENLKNFARFMDYAAANVADWYKFVNGPRGREAKNGDVRLVVGFDKTTCWGMATFANHTQNNCRLRFGPSEGDSASTYTWSEYSGVTNVRAGPDSDENDELKRDGDPPDVHFENQCLFVRTLNITLQDDVWADIHSGLGSVHTRNSQYPHVKGHSSPNHPHSSSPGTGSGSGFSPSPEAQYGTQRTKGSVFESQDVDVVSDNHPGIFISGPLESLTAHPSKVLNDILLATVPTAKMAITHDDDWSSVITQYDSTLPDPHDLVANILASRNICEDNGVVFLQPIQNEASEISVKRVQASTEHNLDTQSTMDEDFQRALVPVSSVDGILERTERETKYSGREKERNPEEKFERRYIFGDKPLSRNDLSPDDIIIVVVGPVGSGKSRFISTITGLNTAVGHSLSPCTKEIAAFRCSLPGLAYGDLVFVDTPGFDDTDKFDGDVLRMVHQWLKSTYGKGIKLSGLLFFHRISDNRISGTSLRNLPMFEELCGKNAFQNIILTTTMWDEVDKETGEARESELKSTYWRPMLQRNSTTSRFMGTRRSVFTVIDPLIDTANVRSFVLLQQELVGMRKKLSPTSRAAGRAQELFSTIEVLLRQCEDLLRRIRNEIKSGGGDEMVLERLQDEYQKLKINLESTIDDMRRLKLPLGQRLVNMTDRFFTSNLTSKLFR